MVTATAFTTMLDNTVVNVSAPSIARDLGAGLPLLQWLAVGYMLSYAGLMTAGGVLADRFGRARLLRAGLAVFTAASMGAGLAGTAGMLVAGRVAQGIGAALLVPAALAIATGGDERDRMRATAAWTAAGAVALAVGPVLGGVISQQWGWRWIFLLNVPVGLAALAAGGWLADGRRDRGAAALDLPGMAVCTLGLCSVAYLLIGGPGRGWAAVAAVAAAAGLVAVERRARQPVLDPRVFGCRIFAGGLVVQVLWGLCVTGASFYTALYLQQTRGYPPVVAGAAFLPVAAAVALGAPLTPVLVRRHGPSRTVASGLVLVAAGLAGVAVAGAFAGLPAMLAALFVVGVGSALTVPLTAVVVAAVPPDRAGVAAAVFGTAREFSGVLGVGGLGVLVSAGHGLARGYPLGLAAAAVLALAAAVVGACTLPGAGA